MNRYFGLPFLGLLILLALLSASAGWGREILVTAGDTLYIKVEGEQAMCKAYLVTEEGKITLPEVGEFKAAGQTLTQLKESLTKAIGDYVRNPQVTVDMPAAAQTREILVYGEVRRPGTVAIKGDFRLMDVLNAVGGVSDSADQAKAVIYEKGAVKGTSLELEALLKGDLSKNTVVHEGDTLFIPAKTQGTITIAGQIRNPGEHVAKTGMTVMDAIVQAGGFTPEADKKQVRISSKDKSPVVANLEEEPSANGVPAWQTITLQSGDSVWVPENKDAYFNVLGGVKNPGQYPIKKKIFITDAVTLAGGFVDRARTDHVKLARAAAAGAAVETKDINMARLFKGDISQNVEVHAGDTISVEVGREKRSAQDVIFKDILPLATTILYWGVLR